jgi:hypothetical protein
MDEKNQKKPLRFYYILMTSLFYPAVLGGLFYAFLEECYRCKDEINRLVYLVACLGIIGSFSLDFLYTWISKKHYTLKLFLADIIVLFLIFIAYRDLVDGIARTSNVGLFFLCFIFVHCIFAIWDLFFIPRRTRLTNIIIYDFVGIIFSTIGYMKFKTSPLLGVILLWIFTLSLIFLSGRKLVKSVK